MLNSRPLLSPFTPSPGVTSPITPPLPTKTGRLPSSSSLGILVNLSRYRPSASLDVFPEFSQPPFSTSFDLSHRFQETNINSGSYALKKSSPFYYREWLPVQPSAQQYQSYSGTNISLNTSANTARPSRSRCQCPAEASIQAWAGETNYYTLSSTTSSVKSFTVIDHMLTMPRLP
jgi:hypothetical protein